MSTTEPAHPVLSLRGVAFERAGRSILRSVDWEVGEGQRWVVLGPNGCGKTTLARIATMWEHPSGGEIELLGERLGNTDVRSLRQRVSLVSAAMADMVRPALTALEVVVCARFAALEPWWHSYSDADMERAAAMLADQGLADFSGRAFGTLSSGERQRVLLARAVMSRPEFLVLDEPSAGLDLAGREQLLERLDVLASDPGAAPTVLVTHHVEEIPPSYTHVLALREGRTLASGPLEDTLSDELLSACFGLSVRLDRHDSPSGVRYSARQDR